MEFKKLGEIFKITSGGTPSKSNNEFYENGTIPWIKTGDLKEKNLLKSSEFITELAVEKSSAKLFPKNTVLIAMYGATIGATSILKIEATTNQACCAFLPSEEIIADFLYYYFKANKSEIVSLGVGGAQPNISATILKNIKIPVLSSIEQQKIICTLDKAQELIDKRKAQIEALDELVKSQFIEMFGDPVQNPFRWKLKPFLKSGSCKNGMNFSATETGIELQYLGVGDFKDLSKIEDVTNLGKVNLNKMPSKEYLLQNGDIVFVRSNGNKALVGRCLAVYPNDVATTYSGFCIRYRKTDENIEIPYLLQVLKTHSMRKNMAGRGANIQNLNQQILGELMIPIPPLELQKQYSEFVKEVDKLKFEMEKSLKELEDNFNSLMQKAFNGQLFNK